MIKKYKIILVESTTTYHLIFRWNNEWSLCLYFIISKILNTMKSLFLKMGHLGLFFDDEIPNHHPPVSAFDWNMVQLESLA